MYRCKDCGVFFDEPYEVYDDPSPAGVSLPRGHYVYYECPECGGDDFEEAKECPCCGDHYVGDTVICEDCIESLGYELAALKGKMHLVEDEFQEAIVTYYGW